MFKFLHSYHPKVWEAQVKAGLVLENDGIRFCQSIMNPEELMFNNLAKKGGELYNILKQRKCPFYIDRLQGGTYIFDYKYDEELLKEYKDLLGDNFWGFQMHEWFSNYNSDVLRLEGLPEEDWTEEKITAFVNENFNTPYLFLESMTAKEMAYYGNPKTVEEFYNNMTSIYKKRMQVGELIPCDSGYLAYQFEISCGTKRIMPEVGGQTPNARIQICYARGMTRDNNRSFGVYYEPWGGDPFSTCCFHVDGENEWGVSGENFPYASAGANGGSSRSLQKRIFLYAYLSNAEFISEEWGLANVFTNWENFELSEYGKVKKEFVDFVSKYKNVGKKIAPIAIVLPKELTVLDNIWSPNVFCGREVDDAVKLPKIKAEISDILASATEMLGNETRTLINSDIPDAIDMLNEDAGDLSKYKYLIDLTFSTDFAKNNKNICKKEDITEILKSNLPCFVSGGLHWLVNECTDGGYYLSVFNHSGICRSVAEGEKALEEAQKTVTVTFLSDSDPKLLEGNCKFERTNDNYSLTIPGGEWAFIKF